MRTLQTGNSSRFTALAALARCVIDAPAGAQGVPCVCPRVVHKDGKTLLVAKTGNNKLDTQLVLADKDPQRVTACFEYFKERLRAIGMRVVADESQLHAT